MFPKNPFNLKILLDKYVSELWRIDKYISEHSRRTINACACEKGTRTKEPTQSKVRKKNWELVTNCF
jgi:hypothetical protein